MAETHAGRCTVIKPPKKSPVHGISIFLSGSIEPHTATPWQSKVTSMLSHLEITVINPLREDWDSSWVQDISNHQFKEQVTWELDYVDAADIVAVYLASGTTSPVTMFEFGLNARAGKVVVCCPEGFERRGNVQVVCERFQIPLVNSLDELAALVGKLVRQKQGI